MTNSYDNSSGAVATTTDGCVPAGTSVSMATALPPSQASAAVSNPAVCYNLPSTQDLERNVYKVFTTTLQLYKPEEIMLSFNGGKDCTVVLHMLLRFFCNSNILNESISLPVLYIESDDAFEEIENFVNWCGKQYSIWLIRSKGNIKEALIDVCNARPDIKAVFMGSRRTDPYCSKLNVMQMTDPGWPPLMRINPIIDWTCHDVWNYIRRHKVPYCSLYDSGYTSLGNKTNTKKNPNLRVVDPKTCKIIRYRPAYELTDCSLERAGRT